MRQESTHLSYMPKLRRITHGLSVIVCTAFGLLVEQRLGFWGFGFIRVGFEVEKQLGTSTIAASLGCGCKSW